MANYKDFYVYFNELKRISSKQILSICNLSYYLLYQQPISFTLDMILYKKESDENETDLMVEEDLRTRKINESFHISYHLEQQLWNSIREGNKEKLKFHLEQMDIDKVSILSPHSNIRSIKNHSIITISLATRAAIEGGVNSELAYTMSDFYILKIEAFSQIDDIHSTVHSFLFKLAEKVVENKTSPYSKYIRLCMTYIFNHIYDELSSKVLGDYIGLNPVYLSQLFKKEVGIPLGCYIKQERLKEAKRLLCHSDYTISSICMMLHFHDQSHFSSIFKKETGETPSKYRKNAQ
ncbi:helix-turn-helix domain-containing protein [Bacillus sp. FSL W8-0645]|uniref:helix-turn-helix domain-containing protein n=1 Tax=Bacillus TaxID=1386 RepID=UPI0030FAE5DF